MQVHCDGRQWTCIVRDVRLQEVTASEHKLPNNEQKWRQGNEQKKKTR